MPFEGGYEKSLGRERDIVKPPRQQFAVRRQTCGDRKWLMTFRNAATGAALQPEAFSQ